MWIYSYTHNETWKKQISSKHFEEKEDTIRLSYVMQMDKVWILNYLLHSEHFLLFPNIVTNYKLWSK